MARKTVTKDQEQNQQTTELPESVISEVPIDLEAALKELSLEIAKLKVKAELEAHVLNWMNLILRSSAPEHVQIRHEIVRDLKAALAASVLSDCLSGAITDSQKLLTQSTPAEIAR